MIYLSLVTINAVLLAFYIIWHQKGSGIGDELYGGVAIYFNENKPKELLGYIVGALIMFVGFLIYSVGYGARQSLQIAKIILVYVSDGMRIQMSNASNYLHLVLMPVIVLVFIHDLRIRVFLQLYVLLYLILMPFVRMYIEKAGGSVGKKRYWQVIEWVLALFMILQIAYVFSDHINGKPKLINEFYNLPEKTVLGGELVDNTEYLNDHFMLGPSNKWDIDKPLVDDNYINVVLLKKDLLRPSVSDSLMYYNSSDKRLYLNGRVNDDLVSLYNDTHLSKINARNSYYQQITSLRKNRYEGLEKKFINYNEYEVHWQILDRYMFHHHGFILNPVSDFDLGVPISNVKAQYGIGNVLMFWLILKSLGGISLENWLKINASFYVLYYFVYAIVLFAVFPKKIVSIFVLVLSVALLYMHGYEFLILAPGDSPWRNFFDIVILLLFYKYQQTDKAIFVVLALMLGVLSVFINPQIGMMIMLASVVSLLIILIYDNRFNIFWGGVIGVFVLMSMIVFVITSSEGDLAMYYMKGVIGFPIAMSSMVLILVAILIGYIVLVGLISAKHRIDLLSYMYLFFYVQLLIIYYVWHADMNGLLSRSHIYALAAAYSCYIVADSVDKGLIWRKTTFWSVMVLTFVLYMDASAKVYKDKLNYNKIFNRHQTYSWDFDRAKIVTTVNPSYFKEAVSMIEKYNGDDKNIYIISKYDNVLSFLSHKISDMPFHELKWYNMTDKELNKSSQIIKIRKPEYLYVDTDINRDYNDDVISSSMPVYGYLHQESVWRAERLKLMAIIFQEVSDQYTLVESGKLLSVYKRVSI